MGKFLKEHPLRRSSKLFLLSLALVGTAMVMTPPDLSANNVCFGHPNTAFPMTVTYYFTDASYSTIACVADECNSSWCDPTPYSQSYVYCCTPP
jgi:hypothetical protein